MKKIPVVAGVLIGLWLGAAALQAAPQAGPDEKLFQDAKLLIFDKKWEAALDKLEVLRADYPKSPYAAQAVFYRAECLSSLEGREREALQAYKDYIKLAEANASLVEESEGSIIELAFSLYGKGDRSVLREITTRLDHPNKVVRYYAAYKLSLVADKSEAARAVPVLKDIIATEKDPELKDRARIALLRVSPESLKSVEEKQPERRPDDAPRVLRIRITKQGQKEPVLSLNIPWSLADLAINSLDEEEKEALRKKGYSIDRIMNDLAKSKEAILKIVGEDGSIIEIWIE